MGQCTLNEGGQQCCEELTIANADTVTAKAAIT